MHTPQIVEVVGEGAAYRRTGMIGSQAINGLYRNLVLLPTATNKSQPGRIQRLEQRFDIGLIAAPVLQAAEKCQIISRHEIERSHDPGIGCKRQKVIGNV